MPKKSEPIGDPIIDQLRAEREARGLAQREVGHMVGNVTYQGIHALEVGKNSPTLRTLRRWADVLGFLLALAPKTDGKRWYRVLGKSGAVFCETSDRLEALDALNVLSDGARIQVCRMISVLTPWVDDDEPVHKERVA